MMIDLTAALPFFFYLLGFGLVAAMTLPALYARYQESVTKRRMILALAQNTPSISNIDKQSRESNQNTIKLKELLWLIIGALAGLILIRLQPIHDWSVITRSLIFSVAVFVGYRIPKMEKEGREKARRLAIARDLPRITDLLIVMLDAGATFDQAILRLIKDPRFPKGPIYRELQNLSFELSLSPDRKTAFNKFASASDLTDMRLFSSVLVQSEMFGTPISKGLRALAHDMREKQFHALDAQGGKLGPKLTIPMTIFFLPIIFIIILAPTLIRFFQLP